VAGLAVRLAIVLGQSGRIKALIARLAAQASLVPITTRTKSLFGVVNGLAAARADQFSFPGIDEL